MRPLLLQVSDASFYFMTVASACVTFSRSAKTFCKRDRCGQTDVKAHEQLKTLSGRRCEEDYLRQRLMGFQGDTS